MNGTHSNLFMPSSVEWIGGTFCGHLQMYHEEGGKGGNYERNYTFIQMYRSTLNQNALEGRKETLI